MSRAPFLLQRRSIARKSTPTIGAAPDCADSTPRNSLFRTALYSSRVSCRFLHIISPGTAPLLFYIYYGSLCR